MHFDKITDRTNCRSLKWDAMERAFGVPANGGLPMWIADKDFEAPAFLTNAMQELINKENYGYFSGHEKCLEAVQWWMETRHNWKIEQDWMFTTYGLGHGIATTLLALTEPGDAVVTFTPVYHEFENKITKAGRTNTQLPLIKDAAGLYRMEFDAYEALMTGKERLMLISTPHNPAGRVWEQAELDALADFCQRHDLLLVADEIHHDLIFPGQKHLTTAVALSQILDRLVITTAASKTFSIAGGRTGFVIIPDDTLRARFAAFFNQFDVSANLMGSTLTQAAYSPEGAVYVDELRAYLAGNYDVFKHALDKVDGVEMMPMQSTYLAWVDFAGTGMDRETFTYHVYGKARIAATPGHTLGQGGASFLRFNLGTQRARVEDAAERLTTAFAGR
jgi:cystathionine beta-lyase